MISGQSLPKGVLVLNGRIKIHYLYHSGFAVQIDDRLLVFDYYLDRPEGGVRSLDTGVINPEEIKGYETFVFSSHRHPDHFNPVIFNWREQVPRIQYILSWDIPRKFHAGNIVMRPGDSICPGEDIRVATLKSTDEGVAFLVEVNGVVIYHAGDLNWWHWEEEPKAWNNDMAARFKREMERLKGIKIDIAFLTADPRQESHALLGMEYFIDHVGAGIIFPMHFGDDYGIMDVIRQKKTLHPGFGVVQPITGRGACFVL